MGINKARPPARRAQPATRPPPHPESGSNPRESRLSIRGVRRQSRNVRYIPGRTMGACVVSSQGRMTPRSRGHGCELTSHQRRSKQASCAHHRATWSLRNPEVVCMLPVLDRTKFAPALYGPAGTTAITLQAPAMTVDPVPVTLPLMIDFLSAIPGCCLLSKVVCWVKLRVGCKRYVQVKARPSVLKQGL